MKRHTTLLITCLCLLVLARSVFGAEKEIAQVPSVAKDGTVLYYLSLPDTDTIHAAGNFTVSETESVHVAATEIVLEPNFLADEGSEFETRLWGNGNTPPRAFGDLYRIKEESGAQNLPVLANDHDADSIDVLELLSIDTSVGTKGAVAATLGVNGFVSYTPPANFAGTDSFRYTIRDGKGDTDTTTVIVMVFNVNDPPVAVDDSVSTPEDTEITFNPLTHGTVADSDLDGDTLAILGTSNPHHGTAVLNNNAVTYTPDSNYYGTDTFTYNINDGNGGQDYATVTITINPVDDDPVAVDDVFEVLPGQTSYTLSGVLGNDFDPEGSAVSLTGVFATVPAGATAEQNGASITYTPASNIAGTVETFTYEIQDAGGKTATAAIKLNIVTPANTAPTANDDSFNILKNTSSATLQVLLNDSDPEEAVLTITGLDTTGTTGIVANHGSYLIYTPQAGSTDPDSFSYTIQDPGGVSDTATVNITIDGRCGASCLASQPQTCTTNVVPDLVLSGITELSGTVSEYFASHTITAASGYTAQSGATVKMAAGTIYLEPEFLADSGSEMLIDPWATGPDTLAPTITWADPAYDPPNIASFRYNLDTFKMVISYSDNASGVKYVQLFDGNGVDITCEPGVTVTSDQLTYDFPQALATGTYNFSIVLEDFAGNRAIYDDYSFTVTRDSTAPITKATPAGGVYNQGGFTVELTCDTCATENDTAVIYYTVDNSLGEITVHNTTSGNAPITGIQIPGNTYLKFFGVDQAGNIEPLHTEIYIIDQNAGVDPYDHAAPQKPVLMYEYDALGRIKRIMRKR